MDVPNSMRIVLLGKTGAGKSSLANTIFGNNAFEVRHLSDSQANICQAKSGFFNGRSLTLIDTPGFFYPGMSEWKLRSEIVRCITECAAGPHAFLIVLQVQKFTQQEKEVIRLIQDYFSPEVLKYSAVVFTHGDQLSEGMKIEAFVRKNEHLKDLVEQCGGRCYVTDNKYWNNNQQDEYRNNKVQVAQLLSAVETMVKERKGGCYTTEMLKEWERPSSASFLRFFKRLIKYTKPNVRVCFGAAVIIGVLLIATIARNQVAAVRGETHTFL